MAKMNKRLAELVLVPTPGMGHLLSAVKLAKLIVDRDDRITISIFILNVPLDYSKVSNYIESQIRDNLNPKGITFVTLPPLSNPPDPTSPNYLTTFVDLHTPLVKEAILGRAWGGSSGPSGLILDMLCTKMIDIANDLNIPSYIFFASGANFLSLMFHFQSLADSKGIDITDEFNNPDTEFDVPGFMNRLTGKVVPRIFLEKEGGCSVIIEHTRRFRHAKGILVNTFQDLDMSLIQALTTNHQIDYDGSQDSIIPSIYPVGPILELDSESPSGPIGHDQDSIIRWLNDQPPLSVVFLCFGSMGSFDTDQVKEIAKGLESSGHNFLWSLRKPPSSEGKYGLPTDYETFLDVLPEGFLDRTSKRGKIIGWAPQVSILAHRAIGGFVSHCGWNSTLESLWFGVPMATWPIYAEQQLNAFQLVKELGIGVEIRMDYKHNWKTKKGNFQVSAEEIENGVRKLMNMDEETNTRVRRMSDKGRKSLENGGSSHYYLGRFIDDVLSYVTKEHNGLKTYLV